MRKLLLLAVALPLLILLLLALGGGSILCAGLEKGTAAATGLSSHVDSASLNLFAGSVAVSGFRLGNPPGFKTDSALAVGRLSVDASLPSLLSDMVVVDSIEIVEPEITLEVSATGTNVGEILDRLEGKRGPADRKPGGSGAEGKKLRVAEIRIRGARVRLGAPLLAPVPTTIPLGDLTLRELGSGAKKDESTLGQLLEKVLGALALAAARSTGDLPKGVADLLRRETARPTLDAVRRDVEAAARGVVDRATKELERAAGEAVKGLPELLGPGKKKKRKED
ncbi:MAG TPA: hypothetical protein VFI25_01140 [Planctomycetota bacterium]|jgi:hypothetical protein|nr:hypothetical protein [Planctomycetota bacterium]